MSRRVVGVLNSNRDRDVIMRYDNDNAISGLAI